jgi:hypothetical protein
MWLEIPFGLKIQPSTIQENTKRHQKMNAEISLKIFLRVARNCKLSFYTLVSLICSHYWAILAQKYNQKWKIGAFVVKYEGFSLQAQETNKSPYKA